MHPAPAPLFLFVFSFFSVFVSEMFFLRALCAGGYSLLLYMRRSKAEQAARRAKSTCGPQLRPTAPHRAALLASLTHRSFALSYPAHQSPPCFARVRLKPSSYIICHDGDKRLALLLRRPFRCSGPVVTRSRQWGFYRVIKKMKARSHGRNSLYEMPTPYRASPLPVTNMVKFGWSRIALL